MFLQNVAQLRVERMQLKNNLDEKEKELARLHLELSLNQRALERKLQLCQRADDVLETFF